VLTDDPFKIDLFLAVVTAVTIDYQQKFPYESVGGQIYDRALELTEGIYEAHLVDNTKKQVTNG